jgi:hypothetical protein
MSLHRFVFLTTDEFNKIKENNELQQKMNDKIMLENYVYIIYDKSKYEPSNISINTAMLRKDINFEVYDKENEKNYNLIWPQNIKGGKIFINMLFLEKYGNKNFCVVL